MTHTTSSRGFTLLETLIATGLIVTTVAGLAQLFALSARFTRDSGQFGVALVAAQDKLESLRAARYDYDEDGAPVTDPALHVSSPGALAGDVPNYVDWLDERGSALGNHDGAVYVRRWRITPMTGDEPAAIAIEVCVFRAPAVGAEPAAADACLATIRVRQP